MVTVACVQVDNYLGRGTEYVTNLSAMVARNLSVPFEFVCLSPDIPGWWAKTALFKPGTFTGRILYLDLDTVVTGSLDELVEYKGLLHLDRWGWTTKTYGTGVMVWDAGEHAEIWELFNPDVPNQFRGDQDFVTSLGGWDALPDGMNVSYRYHAKNGPPHGAVTVSMHGRPKPHEVTTGWVPKYWCA